MVISKGLLRRIRDSHENLGLAMQTSGYAQNQLCNLHSELGELLNAFLQQNNYFTTNTTRLVDSPMWKMNALTSLDFLSRDIRENFPDSPERQKICDKISQIYTAVNGAV